jgi:hypothetical protein
MVLTMLTSGLIGSGSNFSVQRTPMIQIVLVGLYIIIIFIYKSLHGVVNLLGFCRRYGVHYEYLKTEVELKHHEDPRPPTPPVWPKIILRGGPPFL